MIRHWKLMISATLEMAFTIEDKRENNPKPHSIIVNPTSDSRLIFDFGITNMHIANRTRE
jgi:hypothetical protein